MQIRLATFNVENLFSRPAAMNLPSWSEGQPILNAYNSLNVLLNKEIYASDDRQQILKLLGDFGLLKARPDNPFIELRMIRGRLFQTHEDREPEIVAKGRSDWVGWVELKKEAIEDQAIENTARVIAEVNPDILVLAEVENRVVLQQFYDQVLAPMLKARGQKGYLFNMIIDGNDRRGIDVGILSRFPISSMRSHIEDSGEDDGKIFSRDCPEYYINVSDDISGDRELLVLPNHFASKGSDRSGARRRVQAERVKEIYEGLKAEHSRIVVAGDLNDHPEGGSLGALLDGTDLKDAMSLPVYQGFPGTYNHANARDKLDYLLLSPALVGGVAAVNVERRGFYAPTKWPSFENITKETKDRYQASDHHCLWADIEL